MKNGFLQKVLLLVLISVVFTGVLMLQENRAYATTATPISVKSVDYINEQIIVNNNGNSKICFATEAEAARDNWEVIDADSNATGTTWIDISWLSSTTQNILFIKGAEDPSATKSRIILRARPSKLELSISYENLDSLAANKTIASLVNIMSSVGTGDAPITFADLEWKKGVNGKWESTDSLIAEKMEKFLIKGTYLYFRIAAVNDDKLTSLADKSIDGSEGRRYSSEIKVKIAKKAVASNYTVDGEKFIAEIKYGKEYRVTANSTTSSWIKITDRATKSVDLQTIVSKALGTGTVYDGFTPASAFPAMKLEIRDYASTKAAASKITTITINKQREITATTTPGPAPSDATTSDSKIYVSYNGNKNMVLEIPSATTALPYEYCVVKKGDTFNVKKAVWTSVTKGTAVKILASKAVDGGTLYIRQKEIKSSDATNITVASTYATCTIDYPFVPEIADTDIEKTFNKDNPQDITFTITMKSASKAAYETKVDTIKLGTRKIDFTSDPAVLGTTGTTLTITLKKDSLAALPNCYRKGITITFGKDTVIKNSILLTVKNAEAAGVLGLSVSKPATGTAVFTVITTKASGSKWVYVVTADEIKNVKNVDTVVKVAPTPIVGPVSDATSPSGNIAIADKQWLTVFEVDASGLILKYKSVQIVY